MERKGKVKIYYATSELYRVCEQEHSGGHIQGREKMRKSRNWADSQMQSGIEKSREGVEFEVKSGRGRTADVLGGSTGANPSCCWGRKTTRAPLQASQTALKSMLCRLRLLSAEVLLLPFPTCWLPLTDPGQTKSQPSLESSPCLPEKWLFSSPAALAGWSSALPRALWAAFQFQLSPPHWGLLAGGNQPSRCPGCQQGAWPQIGTQ